jgi:molybdate transport system substrate-binding protein
VVSYTGQIISLLLLALASAAAQPKPEVVVAAAANLTQTLQELGPGFEAETGIHPVFSFGSTAQLAQQAQYGAPFDVFLAADDEHILQLERQGMLEPASRAVYARGIVALWIPPGGKSGVKRMEDLLSPEIRIIAIAKPELAPYGAAAVAALQRAGIWNRIQPKVVYAENINMARQYGALQNADAVFTAYALVRNAAGTVIRVDPSLHPPLQQALGILARAEHPAAARKFVDYLLRGKGRDALLRDGYLLPGGWF